ncbi:MAG TPA: diacylglycerol kinase family protein [Ideonella sp.]|uniref:diacylglycerol/lipid kinase family protein n=1 Tax=Ideonella sp. TaxID=1929293 RepID=UPI002E37E882|nr:diacylglycerol kinase family protein [Ideonella sp.]HEX5684313.1 diacylglycerol kinase family protein [Ideonella sp.]
MPRTDAPLFIVLNEGAGREDAADVQQTIERVLREGGRTHQVMLAGGGRDLAAVARAAVEAARGCGGIVVAAGGDGTINTVANAVMGSGCAMGVLPQGTFNYFGRTHGIPQDTAEATRLLLTGVPQPVQVGLVNDHAFLVNASLGLYPQLLEDREAYKQRFGRSRWVAWWAAAVSMLQAYRPLRLELASGGQARSIRTPTLFVGNNALQLEQIGIAQASAVSQRALVAITLRPVGTLAMAWLMLRGAFGQLGEAGDVFSFAFDTLSVRPAAPLGRRRIKVATDGEVFRLRAPLLFRVAPQPLMLIKPPAEAA